MNAVNQSEFARLMGIVPSAVTALKQAGRLVLDGKGKVLVDESRRRIEETATPSHEGVKQRHARERAAKAEGAPPAADIEVSLIEVRKRREMANAEIAEMERDKMRGLLVDVADVRRVFAAAGTMVRQGLESVPDRLAPELSGLTDQAAIHARLAEEMEAVLVNLNAQMEKL